MDSSDDDENPLVMDVEEDKPSTEPSPTKSITNKEPELPLTQETNVTLINPTNEATEKEHIKPAKKTNKKKETKMTIKKPKTRICTSMRKVQKMKLTLKRGTKTVSQKLPSLQNFKIIDMTPKFVKAIETSNSKELQNKSITEKANDTEQIFSNYKLSDVKSLSNERIETLNSTSDIDLKKLENEDRNEIGNIKISDVTSLSNEPQTLNTANEDIIVVNNEKTKDIPSNDSNLSQLRSILSERIVEKNERQMNTMLANLKLTDLRLAGNDRQESNTSESSSSLPSSQTQSTPTPEAPQETEAASERRPSKRKEKKDPVHRQRNSIRVKCTSKPAQDTTCSPVLWGLRGPVLDLLQVARLYEAEPDLHVGLFLEDQLRTAHHAQKKRMSMALNRMALRLRVTREWLLEVLLGMLRLYRVRRTAWFRNHSQPPPEWACELKQTLSSAKAPVPRADILRREKLLRALMRLMRKNRSLRLQQQHLQALATSTGHHPDDLLLLAERWAEVVRGRVRSDAGLPLSALEWRMAGLLALRGQEAVLEPALQGPQGRSLQLLLALLQRTGLHRHDRDKQQDVLRWTALHKLYLQQDRMMCPWWLVRSWWELHQRALKALASWRQGRRLPQPLLLRALQLQPQTPEAWPQLLARLRRLTSATRRWYELHPHYLQLTEEELQTIGPDPEDAQINMNELNPSFADDDVMIIEHEQETIDLDSDDLTSPTPAITTTQTITDAPKTEPTSSTITIETNPIEPFDADLLFTTVDPKEVKTEVILESDSGDESDREGDSIKNGKEGDSNTVANEIDRDSNKIVNELDITKDSSNISCEEDVNTAPMKCEPNIIDPKLLMMPIVRLIDIRHKTNKSIDQKTSLELKTSQESGPFQDVINRIESLISQNDQIKDQQIKDAYQELKIQQNAKVLKQTITQQDIKRSQKLETFQSPKTQRKRKIADSIMFDDGSGTDEENTEVPLVHRHSLHGVFSSIEDRNTPNGEGGKSSKVGEKALEDKEGVPNGVGGGAKKKTILETLLEKKSSPLDEFSTFIQDSRSLERLERMMSESTPDTREGEPPETVGEPPRLKVQLVDLEEVRRRNSSLLTAQVPPLSHAQLRPKSESSGPSWWYPPHPTEVVDVSDGSGSSSDEWSGGSEAEVAGSDPDFSDTEIKGLLQEIEAVPLSRRPSFCCAARRHRAINEARKRVHNKRMLRQPFKDRFIHECSQSCGCCCRGSADSPQLDVDKLQKQLQRQLDSMMQPRDQHSDRLITLLTNKRKAKETQDKGKQKDKEVVVEKKKRQKFKKKPKEKEKKRVVHIQSETTKDDGYKEWIRQKNLASEKYGVKPRPLAPKLPIPREAPSAPHTSQPPPGAAPTSLFSQLTPPGGAPAASSAKQAIPRFPPTSTSTYTIKSFPLGALASTLPAGSPTVVSTMRPLAVGAPTSSFTSLSLRGGAPTVVSTMKPLPGGSPVVSAKLAGTLTPVRLKGTLTPVNLVQPPPGGAPTLITTLQDMKVRKGKASTEPQTSVQSNDAKSRTLLKLMDAEQKKQGGSGKASAYETDPPWQPRNKVGSRVGKSAAAARPRSRKFLRLVQQNGALVLQSRSQATADDDDAAQEVTLTEDQTAKAPVIHAKRKICLPASFRSLLKRTDAASILRLPLNREIVKVGEAKSSEATPLRLLVSPKAADGAGVVTKVTPAAVAVTKVTPAAVAAAAEADELLWLGSRSANGLQLQGHVVLDSERDKLLACRHLMHRRRVARRVASFSAAESSVDLTHEDSLQCHEPMPDD